MILSLNENTLGRLVVVWKKETFTFRGMERECFWQQDKGHISQGCRDPSVGWTFVPGGLQWGNGKVVQASREIQQERDHGVPRDIAHSAGETEAGNRRWEEELLYFALRFSAAKAAGQVPVMLVSFLEVIPARMGQCREPLPGLGKV